MEIIKYNFTHYITFAKIKIKSHKCIDEQELDDKLMIMDLVKQCSISHFGEELLLAMGNATAALDPPHSFIPWITFNGVTFLFDKC